jgi:hypothetical protein
VGPNSNMSPVAILVMALVVLILLGAWLAAVFLLARPPRGENARPGKEVVTHAREPEAVTHGGNVPAEPRVRLPAGRSAQPPGDNGMKEPLPRGASRTG